MTRTPLNPPNPIFPPVLEVTRGVALMTLGFVVGPVQPIAAELAVEARETTRARARVPRALGARVRLPLYPSERPERARGQVTYPAVDENTLVAMLQLCGNLFSAGLVPVADILRRMDLREKVRRGRERRTRENDPPPLFLWV